MSESNHFSCTVASPRECNYTTLNSNNATGNATTDATIDLKALADKVLLRNQQSNFDATGQKIPSNFDEDFTSKKLQSHYSGFTLAQLKQYAKEDWQELWPDSNKLAAFASAMRQTILMKNGAIPKHYIKTVICKNCGEVKLWLECSDTVLGCPWCLIHKCNKKR